MCKGKSGDGDYSELRSEVAESLRLQQIGSPKIGQLGRRDLLAMLTKSAFDVLTIYTPKADTKAIAAIAADARQIAVEIVAAHDLRSA